VDVDNPFGKSGQPLAFSSSSNCWNNEDDLFRVVKGGKLFAAFELFRKMIGLSASVVSAGG